MQEIYIEKIFDAPVWKVFNELSDHEKLETVFGAKIKRIKDGRDGFTNGKGSVRKISLFPGVNFEETVATFIPNQIIEYFISKGSPLKNHKGRMEFMPMGKKTYLRYKIVFESKFPLPWLGEITRIGLKAKISNGLNRVAKKLV